MTVQDVGNTKRGRRGDHWRHSKRRVPRYSADYQTPFGGAAKALKIDSDRKLSEILSQLAGKTIKRQAIRDWRRGKTKAPEWALDILAAASAELRAMADKADRYLARAKKEAAEAAP